MDKLKINLFGMFEARAQGVPLRLPTRRVELILALLALSPDKAISRSYLATLLWPEQEAAQARGSLRQALFRLRGALGADHEAALEATTGWVKLRREAITLDTDAMAEDNASSDAVPDGIPLDGLSGFEPEIEELIDTARADLRRQLCAWHAAAATRAEAEHRYVDLEGHARRQLALEPYDEAALRDLMNALWRQGRRNSALSVFRQTSRRIREDLSVSVETETSSLYAEIRGSGELRDEDETQSDQAAMREELKTAEIEPAVLAESGTSPSTTENNEDGPVHLRHLAVIHVRSERLRIALRDPDPESADAASRRAVHDISLVVDREGGEIIGHAGHQLSAVFGARRPDESPALSAALAGFEIAGLDCAVGIHAGASLVGTQSGTFPLVLLAQALSAAAVAGEVRITAEVEASCHGAFEFAEADAVPGEDGTKGAATWRIRREKSARSGFDIRKARGLSNFCGRKEELTVLADVATMGGSRVAVIIGAAGIGKSRLAHEFLNHHEPQTLLRVQFARSGPGGGLSCFAGMLRFLLDIDPERKSPPLSELLPPDLFPPEISGKIAPALGSILGQADQERSWLDLSRGHRFQALADVLLTVMEAFAGSNCVLLVEDAHWADEEAELLLERLVLSLGVASPMLIITRRPGKAESWLGQEHVKALTLRPLAMDDAAGLLETLDLPSSTQATILERSEGVPLFLEELLRAAVSDKTLLNTAEDVTDRLSHIPVGLRGILSFRIDALPGPARRGSGGGSGAGCRAVRRSSHRAQQPQGRRL
ncbi:AAA family ATPase [uncultured Cohaesibacter sp.]|uniref:AAA family ATPase n=1 Tax=uncultured Cohaesibacter sp. TaxID=1002546 RepID=UPI0029C658B2|nr:AAA family ATPase [uncultured Cohaesibacter sp.]